jgi:hypothetical protein
MKCMFCLRGRRTAGATPVSMCATSKSLITQQRGGASISSGDGYPDSGHHILIDHQPLGTSVSVPASEEINSLDLKRTC